MTGSPTEDATSRTAARGSAPRAAVALIALVALGVRLPALFQDPWIDEIWTWGLVRHAESLWGALASPTSNNHPLHTAWVWLAGDRASFWPYRLPALAAGVASVVLAARIAGRHGRAASVCAAVAVASCYPLVVYSSEARGYAPLVFFSLLAYEAAWTWIDAGRRRWLYAAWLAAILGFLSQYLFVVGWAAVLSGVALRTAGPARGARRGLAPLALIAGPPLAACAAWGWFVARHVVNAGAPPFDAWQVVATTITWTLGWPSWAAIPGAAFVALVLVLDARQLARRGDATWVVQVAGALVLPAAAAFLLRDEYLAPRYFLVALAFWLLSLARVLGRGIEAGGFSRAGALVVLAVFVVGNAARTIPFLRVGRGTNGELVQSMARLSTSPRVRVGGNYDFNVGAQLEWHARALPRGRGLEYVSAGRVASEGAEFLVIDEPQAPADVARRLGVGAFRFELVGESRHVGPCGADWALYQRR
jgi:hypothetical protein